jgi:hypothetical protein
MNNNRLLLVSTTFNIMNAVSIIYIFPLLGKAIILSEIPVNYYSLSFFFAILKVPERQGSLYILEIN